MLRSIILPLRQSRCLHCTRAGMPTLAFHRSVRHQGSSSSSSSVSKPLSEGEKYDVVEEEISITSFEPPKPVHEYPISSLDAATRIEKVKKPGSFSADLFITEFDVDFLTYPELLYDRKESQQIYQQSRMVQQLWPRLYNDPEGLQRYNFHNLYQLSATEMMTVFEAIGVSSRQCFELDAREALVGKTKEKKVTIVNDFDHVQVTKSIVSLITRNCLTYYPMQMSQNQTLKDRFLPPPFVEFKKQPHSRVLPMIGFAFTERAPHLGSLPPQEWNTKGIDGGKDADAWVVKGSKSRVFHDPSIEHYMVFFRDSVVSEANLARNRNKKKDDQEPNPAADPISGAVLIPKSDMKEISDVYIDSSGLPYVDLKIDTLVTKELEVFPPQRRNAHPLNIKGLGQLASCAVVFGLLRDAQRRTYSYLLKNRRGILDCEIVEHIMAKATQKLYAMESMIYFVAGMYDGLEPGFDAHLEAAMTKIVAMEYGRQVLQHLQQMCGSDMLLTSRLQDLINIFDSFMDGAIYNRIYLCQMGLLWYGRHYNIHLNKLRLAPWHPGYNIRHSFRETSEQNDWLTLDKDLKGNVHPALETAAAHLEFAIKRVKFAAETLLKRYGEDALRHQSDLYRLSDIVIDTFMLTTMMARASRAYCAGVRNGQQEISMVVATSDEIAYRVRILMQELEANPICTIDQAALETNSLNLRCGGYFPTSPLDVNV